MTTALKKLKKLKGRSFDEFRVRGAQAVAAYSERLGWSSQACVPDDATFFKMLDATKSDYAFDSAENLLEHFRTRAAPNFFAAFSGREKTSAELARRFPYAQQTVIERAERISRGRFSLLGLSDLYFGEPVDFHLEPVSGKRSPLTHWSRIGELDAETTGDKKIVWELNRHQYFSTLGRAYWSTGDERYAQIFVQHISHWMEQNPPTLGVNWISNLEVAFRSISWLWAIYFFKDSAHLTPTIFLRMLKFLHLHGQHLEMYLSTYVSPNTHLTGEALGLFYLGTLLPELPRAERWRAKGERVLLQELRRHVKPDGVYFEQTSYYHRYTTDFYTHFYILLEANNRKVKSELEEKLTALLNHLMYITRPDGTTPFFGDDDGGRLAMLHESAPNDFRAALSNGAALFARPDYKYVAGKASEETLWLLGSAGLRAFDDLEAQPPAGTSRAFTDGGYYVMRDGWTPTANYLLIDGGAHGESSCGYAHAHADALSFDLAARGRTLLVDPGTYAYTGAIEMRNSFRSSAAHNTLTIDGESSSVPGDFFSWEHVAAVSVRAWKSHQRFDFFEGQHNGYERFESPATHIRSVLFIKNDYWIVRDYVKTTGKHRYDLHFHFATNANPLIEADDSIVSVDGAALPLMRESKADAPGVRIVTFRVDGGWSVEDGWVSTCYSKKCAAPVGTFSTVAEGTQEFVTFIVPTDAQSPKTCIHELRAKGGRAFELTKRDGCELLALRGEETVVAQRLTSDFDWAWVRTTNDAHDLVETVLLGGRSIVIGDHELFKSEERAGFVFVHIVGDELRVETDVRGRFRVATLGAKRVVVNDKEFAAGGAASLQFAGNRLVNLEGKPAAAEVLA